MSPPRKTKPERWKLGIAAAFLLWSCAPRLGAAESVKERVEASGPSEEMTEDVCLDCHGPAKNPEREKEGRTSSLEVDPKRFSKSVHGQLDCVTCHTKLPHKFGLPRVPCGACHEKQAEVYSRSIHGQHLKAKDPLAPSCQECHGVHYIVPVTHPDSPTAPFNVPHMCARCHAEGAPVARAYDIPQEQILKRYTQSIHGEGLFKQGLVVTAVCTSCHTGHSVLPHTDPDSSVSRANVVETCMRCHGRIEDVHRKIIKGSLWETEPRKIPVCVECHSPHEARKVLYDTRMANADCFFCHGKTEIRAESDGRTLYVDEAAFDGSIHGRKIVACTQCHTEISVAEDRPCSTIQNKVDCAVCHEAEQADYQTGIHGRLHARGDPNAPYCTECHGVHDMMEHAVEPDASEILKQKVRGSPTFVMNVPDLCARCHRKGGQAAVRYLGEEQEVVERYAESIHGKGLNESGLTVTATCVNCHTPHKELPHSDPESSVHDDNIAATCGKCHDGVNELYSVSIHSPSANPTFTRLEGRPDLPRCSDCHTAHTIARTEVTDFKLGIMNQCGKCHLEVTETYFDTYHGKVSKLGEANTAKCYDCHGAHDIHSVNDPRSRLSHQNIVETCAQCHPGSHRRFAGYLTHATHHDPKKYPALFAAFWGMTALLVGTFGFFGLHTLFWLPTSWRMRKHAKELAAASATGEKVYVRFRKRYRFMHLTMILSFFGLAITGMVLKFSYTQWAIVLSQILGGAQIAGFIHRVCAVLMLGLAVVHLKDAFSRYRKSGKTLRQFLFGPNALVPQWNDVREFFGTIRWFLGRGPRPRYGRWTYWEKFDYFAVFWGIAIIGSTGLLLWFPEIGTLLLPGWAINVATIIHSDEALLATGFIFTIHFFNTHFRPEKFPMDTVMFTGRTTLDELKHERPREYEELVESGKLEEHLDEPVPLVLTRGAKVFGLLAVTIGLSLVVLIIYAMLFGYK